jgi:hypothetical protein
MLGAVVTLLITILDPFAQQLVIYPIREVTVDDNGVFVPQATIFRPSTENFSRVLRKALQMVLTLLQTIYTKRLYIMDYGMAHLHGRLYVPMEIAPFLHLSRFRGAVNALTQPTRSA